MAISCDKGKVLLAKLIVSLIFYSLFYFRCFPCVVSASDLDLCSNSDDAIQRHSKSCRFSEDTDDNPAAVLHNKHELQLKKLEDLVGELGQLIGRLESKFDESQIEIKKMLVSSFDDALKEGRFPSKEASSVVKKYNAFWTERFHFTSAVELNTSPSCINLLPRDSEGFSKYFAVGDEKGKVFVFLRNGDLSLEFNTFSDSTEGSRITAMVSYSSIYRNETMIVTGHEDGNIVMHRIWEPSSSEEWNSLHVERLVSFEVPESNKPQISVLEVHNVGRKKYLLATNGDGNIIVFLEDGKFYGIATLRSRPVAFFKQRLLFLTDSGAGSLDLRTMKIKESECEGLNNSVVERYVFDGMDRSKVYGITSEGDLIQTVLLGDSINFKCRIRSKRKLDLSPPISLETIKGYLLITNSNKMLVYNISSQHYVRGNGLRLMFSTSIDDITPSFSNRITTPLLVSDNEKDLLIHLGNGYIALYRSKLPVIKNEFNSLLWTSPVLFFILFLFGAWHFFAKKKDMLTSWGPDDPSVASTEMYEDSGSNREVRVTGLRGSSSLRYVSPPRYVGGEADSFDGALADARFTEVKFRGSNVEGGMRRDKLFGVNDGS